VTDIRKQGKEVCWFSTVCYSSLRLSVKTVMAPAEENRATGAKQTWRGVDVPFEDVRLVTASGTVYPANRAVLSCHSAVFRGMFESCPAKRSEENDFDSSSAAFIEVYCEDTDEQVAALIRYSHDPTALAELLDGDLKWVDLTPLLEIVFKYDVQGAQGLASGVLCC
jgi:BTB/POZ domain